MSPPRKRLNFVLPRSSPRCSSSSSINSGNDASQREIKSWLGIGGTCLVIGGTCLVGQHCRAHRAGDCDGPQALGEGPGRGRSMPRIWELAGRKLSKCRYKLATFQGGAGPEQGRLMLDGKAVKPLITPCQQAGWPLRLMFRV